MSESSKPPLWFMVVAGLALVWNLLGVAAYLGQVMMSDESIAALPEAERALYEGVPAWAVSAFAIAVFGGALGSLLLLLRKRLSVPVLVVSLVGVLVQMYHSFFVANSMEVYGPGAIAMPTMVVVIAFYLVWLSRSSVLRGWLD